MTTAGTRLREGAALTAVAFLLVVYFTWPLAPRLGSVGRTDTGDGQFSIWNIAWVAHAMISPDARVFDANIFHPNRGTLAYSEANLGAGLLAVPGYWLTRNPYVAHNSAVLIGLTCSVIGMFLLARRLSGSVPGALVAAIIFTFCPFLFAHTAHIQLLMIGPLPFVFLALHAFVDRQTLLRAGLLGLSIGVQALFCAYYGVLAGLLVGVGVLFFAVSRGLWRSPKWWGFTLLAAAVSIAVVLPFFLPYLQLQKDTGFGRELDEARRYSADWSAYLASSAWLHEWMVKYIGDFKEVLFPGFAAIVFGAAGLAAGLKRSRETTIFYALIGLLALWSSLGPAAGLYSLLYHTVPVFSLLRAPGRFGLAVSLALAVLSAFGVGALLAKPAPIRGRWVAAGAIVFAIVDLSTTMPFIDVPPFPKAYGVLAISRPGPVAKFPFFYRGTEFHLHSKYMLGSTTHWQPMVNGYSDYIPQEYADFALLLSSFPNPEGFDILRARRVRYVVFHLDSYDSRTRQGVLFRIEAYKAYLKPLVQENDGWLFEIVGWPVQHPDLRPVKAP
jgi:hypothetical protein